MFWRLLGVNLLGGHYIVSATRDVILIVKRGLLNRHFGLWLCVPACLLFYNLIPVSAPNRFSWDEYFSRYRFSLRLLLANKAAHVAAEITASQVEYSGSYAYAENASDYPLYSASSMASGL